MPFNYNGAIPLAYPGSGAFRDALREYGDIAYGPQAIGAAQLAGSGVTDQSAAGYYRSPSVPADTGGAGQEATQARFGNMLAGLAQGRSANNASRQNSLVAGTSGIANTAGAIGSDITNTLGSDLRLTNANNQATSQGVGLGMSGISSLASPTGSLSNIINAFSGKTGTPGVPGVSNATGPQSGLSQLIGMFGSLFGSGSGGSDLQGLDMASSGFGD